MAMLGPCRCHSISVDLPVSAWAFPALAYRLLWLWFWLWPDWWPRPIGTGLASRSASAGQLRCPTLGSGPVPLGLRPLLLPYSQGQALAFLAAACLCLMLRVRPWFSQAQLASVLCLCPWQGSKPGMPLGIPVATFPLPQAPLVLRVKLEQNCERSVKLKQLAPWSVWPYHCQPPPALAFGWWPTAPSPHQPGLAGAPLLAELMAPLPPPQGPRLVSLGSFPNCAHPLQNSFLHFPWPGCSSVLLSALALPCCPGAGQ